MASPDSPDKKRKLFYGWWIVLICSALSTYGAGIFYYGFSTFVKPVITELGWSMALVSGAFSLYRLEAGIAAPAVGFLIDRLGARKLVFAGGVVMGGGFIYLSRVSTVIPFYAAIIIISIGWSACAGSSMGVPLVGKWFVRKRGKALGVYGAGRGLSGLMVPMVAYLIVQYGWRSALAILGVLSWIIVLPLALALKDSPEECGLSPDEDQPSHGHSPLDGAAKPQAVQEVDIPLRKAVLTPALWIISLCLFFHQATQSAVFVHLIPHLLEVGIEPTAAASVLTFIALTSTVSRYGCGWLGDMFSKKWILFILYLLQPIGIFALIRVNDIMSIIPFVLVYSFAYGGIAVIKAAMIGDYYGRRNFGTIYGTIQGLSVGGSIAGPLIAGLVYDLNGSYRLAFTAFAFMMIFAALLVLFLRAPSPAK